ncbi:hypothetical protein FI667_g4346, partial [Globisporangium splendens]
MDGNAGACVYQPNPMSRDSMDAASSHFTCTFWTSRHPPQERGSRRLVTDKRSLFLCDAQVRRFSGRKSAFAAFRQDARRLEAHGGRDDAAASLDIARVPCGRVAPERGPICSGAGAQPAGYACPKKGDVSKQDCHDNLPSYDGQGCVAKEDAVCEIVIGETWGCVFPSVGCSTLVPIPEPQCATWDFDDHDLVANKGGNQVNRLLESISFEASQEDYDESWFVQDGPIRELYACGRKPTPAPTTPAPLHNSKSADANADNTLPNTDSDNSEHNANSNNAVSSDPFSNTMYSDSDAVSSDPFSNTMYSDSDAVSSDPFSNAVSYSGTNYPGSYAMPKSCAPAPGKDGKGKGESDSNEQAQHQQSTPSSSPSTFRGTPHPASNAVSVSLKAESSAPEMTHSTILVAIACVAAAAVVMVIGVIKYARKRAQPMENDQFTRLQCASPASPSLPDAFPAL